MNLETCSAKEAVEWLTLDARFDALRQSLINALNRIDALEQENEQMRNTVQILSDAACTAGLV